MKTTTRLFFISCFALWGFSLKAQFKSATIGIDGLTCSACSFSTEKSIKKLDFVDSIFMELDKNIATVYFKKDKSVSIQQLAQKIVDAGFAVRSMYAIFNFNELTVSNNYCFLFENGFYNFIQIDSEKKLNGYQSVKFIGENFMQKKEFKKWKLLCSSTCKPPIGANKLSEYFITIP